jgi:hypothetical protein
MPISPTDHEVDLVEADKQLKQSDIEVEDEAVEDILNEESDNEITFYKSSPIQMTPLCSINLKSWHRVFNHLYRYALLVSTTAVQFDLSRDLWTLVYAVHAHIKQEIR